MCKIFFSFSRNVFRSETVHLLCSIILESFKLYYFFLTSNTCDEYFAVRTQIRSDCFKLLNICKPGCQRLLMRGFQFRSILYSERCAKTLSSALSKFKCLAAKYSYLNPLWAYFPVMCPRMDRNDGITGRGWAWMSPEETVVVLIH